MKALAIAICLSLVAAGSASAEVKVTLNSGRVSIVAKDATLRQILTEWARVGQTKIVNVERIPGGPMTLELADVPEGQALDVLLRSISGYMAAPRATAIASLSIFDRVIVMPTIAAPHPAVTAQAPAPVFQQPQFAQPTPPADDDADQPPAPGVPGPPRGPVFNAAAAERAARIRVATRSGGADAATTAAATGSDLLSARHLSGYSNGSSCGRSRGPWHDRRAAAAAWPDTAGAWRDSAQWPARPPSWWSGRRFRTAISVAEADGSQCGDR